MGILGQERGRRLSGADHGMRDEPAKEREVRRHALHTGFCEGGGKKRQSFVAVAPVSAMTFAINES